MERLRRTFFHFSSGAWMAIAGISPFVRALCPILLLSALATSVWAQPVTLADLQGAVINVVVDYQVLGRRNGQDFSGADGKLVLMRTFKTGGYKTEVRFARGTQGLTCTARAPMMRESGTKSFSLNSAFGGEIEILRQTQISSSCRITMRN